MMHKYAQMLYGKIRAIYEDIREFDKWKAIHSPDIYWIDVTNIDCNVGDIVTFEEGVGLVFTAAPVTEATLQDLKDAQITYLKDTRDAEEVAPIEYNYHFFDFDDKAIKRINASIVKLKLIGESATISWTTADDEEVNVTYVDLENIISAVADRSNLLHIKYRQLRDLVNSYTEEDKDKIKDVIW